MYTLTPLTWNHYAACRHLFEDVFDISEVSCFVEAWPKRCVDTSHAVLYKGAVVAFALVQTNMTINYICVHSDFQGSGLGSKLLTKILDLCSDKRSIWLRTAADERLVKWYGRYGFRVVETIVEDDEFIGADMVLRHRCRSGL